LIARTPWALLLIAALAAPASAGGADAPLRDAPAIAGGPIEDPLPEPDSTLAEPEDPLDEPSLAPDSASDEDPGVAPDHKDRLEHLVPEIGAHPYRLDDGVRPFAHRIAFSPGFGSLGSERVFAFRAAFHPSSWLGYEWSIEHNPSQSVHAVMHSIGASLRHPLRGRFQPYLSGGYGMMMVFPGRSVNAAPVTKNALYAGGGLELYIRSDLALRADARSATVFGRQRDRDGVVAYDYFEWTTGLTFYRSIRP
jgi:hypothetical protein